MPSHTYDLFRQAILGRKQITCMYQGHRRELCPHTLGHSEGEEMALSFQFAGGSSKGLPPGGQWRCMFLAEVTDAQIRDGEWHTSTGHSRPQTCVKDVDVEVDY